MQDKDDLCSVVQVCADGVRVAVKAKPNSSRARAVRIVDVGEGDFALEIAVAAPPEDGKANKSLQERLAALCGVRKAAVSLVSGAASRHKVFKVIGDHAYICNEITNALKTKDLR